MLQHCCKAVVVQRHSPGLCVWGGTSFLFGCFFGVYVFICILGGRLFDNDFFFPVLGWILFCFILVLCVNALGLVNLLSAAEVLVCPWGDERYFQKQIVQTLNKWFVPVSSLRSRWLPALIEVKSDFYSMTQWFDSISKPGWFGGEVCVKVKTWHESRLKSSADFPKWAGWLQVHCSNSAASSLCKVQVCPLYKNILNSLVL